MTRKPSICRTAPPQSNGGLAVGAGVVVKGVTRAFSQAEANQLNTSQSSLGSLNAIQNYTSQIDNLFGTTAGGLTTALQNYYSGWSDVANNPTSTAARQALLGDAQSLATSFQTHDHPAERPELRRQYADRRRREADQLASASRSPR